MAGGSGGGEGSLYCLERRPPAEGGVGGTAEAFHEEMAAFFLHSSQSEPPVHSTSSHSESSSSITSEVSCCCCWRLLLLALWRSFAKLGACRSRRVKWKITNKFQINLGSSNAGDNFGIESTVKDSNIKWTTPLAENRCAFKQPLWKPQTPNSQHFKDYRPFVRWRGQFPQLQSPLKIRI